MTRAGKLLNLVESGNDVDEFEISLTRATKSLTIVYLKDDTPVSKAIGNSTITRKVFTALKDKGFFSSDYPKECQAGFSPFSNDVAGSWFLNDEGYDYLAKSFRKNKLKLNTAHRLPVEDGKWDTVQKAIGKFTTLEW